MAPWTPTRIAAACLLIASGCGGDGGIGPGLTSGPRITYTRSGLVYRIEAKDGASPENISAKLQQMSSGSDVWINTSPDGAWLLVGTDRFDPECKVDTCLGLVKGDVSSAEAVKVGGQVIHPSGVGAVSSTGNLIVYEESGGAHSRDLWAVTRSGTTWSAPAQLTSASTYDFNQQPAISTDGAKILFDCGPVPYGGVGTAICEVNTNASGFRVVITQTGSPSGFPKTAALHHADYSPDGSIVFEADWAGEQVWRLPSGATTPVQVAPTLTNDNSPCVLMDGKIASLWLGRAGNPQGFHELKLSNTDGSSYIMLVQADIADIGTGCAG